MRHKKLFTLILLINAILLCACGGEEKGEQSRGQAASQSQESLLVLKAHSKECVYLQDIEANTEGETALMSAQLYKGQVKQFWKVTKEDASGNRTLDIYLCSEDGSRELLFENVDKSFSGIWYLDLDGNYFILHGMNITKVDKVGNLFFSQEITQGIADDICQLSDGRVFVLYTDEEGKRGILDMDEASGVCSEMPHIALNEDFRQYISGADGELLWMNADSIFRINPQTGAKTEVMPLTEYHYTLGDSVEDFGVSGEHAATILYPGKCESVTVEDVGKTRTIIHAGALQLFNQFLINDCITEFNRENEEYYLVMDTPGEGEDGADFRTKTDVAIGTGGGPDLIFYNAVSEPNSLADKGAFADLRPFMEQSAVREEDYFSAAFGFMRREEQIYAACVSARPTGLWVSEEVLGSRQEPEIETLVDALLSYRERAVFCISWESNQVLDYFLAGTEDLWGMVDWEKNTCDFSGELFAKMLEAAKRYGFDKTKDLPHVANPMYVRFYTYETLGEMEKAGQVPVGYFFDDGCYQSINHSSAMFINNNSDEAHKQGAWEFIHFLLGPEIQMQLDSATVSRAAYEAIVKREMEEGPISVAEDARGRISKTYKAGPLSAYGNDEEAYRAANTLTQEKADEIRSLLETSHALPTRTAPLLAIISEEASAYFDGSKSIPETVAVIENRVKLYLEENR